MINQRHSSRYLKLDMKAGHADQWDFSWNY